MTDAVDFDRAPRRDEPVQSGDFRVRCLPDAQGRAVMACQVRDGAAWRDSCSGTTSLIGGLDLMVEQQAADGAGLVLHGRAPGPWKGRISPRAGGWIEVDVALDVPPGLPANPELILWLGTVITMHERQTHTFRQTRLSGPTVNCEGVRGNDLPLVYFFDPRVRLETAVYVPATHLTWTTRRFLDYRCDLRVDYAELRYGVGLVNTGSVSSLAAGPHRFVWYVQQRARDIAPSEWDAQRELLAAIEQFIPATETPPAPWGSLASGALRDLLDEPTAQITVEGRIGHPAYILDTSRVRPDDRRPSVLEFMTQADLIPPLALYLKLHPDPIAEDHLRKLTATLPLFHLPARHWMGNWFPSLVSRPIEDIWYFLENALIKLPWVAAITGDDQVWAMFLDALSGAEEMARQLHYVFPLFVDVATRNPVRSATNYSVGGMYAYGQMLAFAHTGDTTHLEEAQRSLAILCRLTIDRMWHEPQQLGFAAAAAALVAHATGDRTAAGWASDLLAAQLRMVYWDDHSPSGDPLSGMFQACASLLYPAFKENVESILPWPHLLRANLAPSTLLLRLLDAQRRHNRAFFDVLRGHTTGPGPSIPLENLGTVELPEEGRLGKELYGTGEVFWLYLLLEALGRADDPEVMICSLDLPGLETLSHFPPASRAFMAYNPTGVARTTTIELRALPVGSYTVRWAGRRAYRVSTTDGCLMIAVSIEAGAAHRLDVAPLQPETSV